VYPQAELIRLVMDNLATHKPAASYETFPPEEARRILRKLEFHYTPKHGSWLNIAEIELSVFGRSMKNHISEEGMFRTEAQSLANGRSASEAIVDWQLRSADVGSN
jgi:hypothetical protein